MTRQPHINANSSGKEYAKFFAVVLFIVTAATFMSLSLQSGIEGWIQWVMGGFFLIFGGFKLIGYEMFVGLFPRYDLFAARSKVYAYIYPILEVLLGGLYILNTGHVVRDAVVLATMISILIGAFRGLVRRGPTRHGVCLGNAIKLPLSTVLLFQAILMGTMAAIMLVGALTGQWR